MDRVREEFISDMTPQVLRKRMTFITAVAVGVVLLIILVPFLSILTLIGLLLTSSNDGSIRIFIVAFLVLIPLAAVYLLMRSHRKLPEDHPFNFIFLTNQGILIRRSILNNDIPTDNLIPFWNIQSITKDHRWYIDQQAKNDGIGWNIFKKAKWVPRGTLWIGMAPKDYHILIKLKRAQRITILTYDRKTKYPSTRVDLTDVVVISVRPEQQRHFLELVEKYVRSPIPMDSDRGGYVNREIDNITNSQNVILREFGTSLTRWDTIIPIIRVNGSTLVFFILATIVMSLLINFHYFHDESDTGETLAVSMCISSIMITILVIVVFLSGWISIFTTYNIKKLRKENKVLVGSRYIEILTRQGIGNSLRFMNRFPKANIKFVRPVSQNDLGKWGLKSSKHRLLGIKNATSIGLHHLFVKRENLLLLKLDREVRLYHDHIKAKWYQNGIGEMWSDEVIIDIPQERQDEFMDVLFSHR